MWKEFPLARGRGRNWSDEFEGAQGRGQGCRSTERSSPRPVEAFAPSVSQVPLNHKILIVGDAPALPTALEAPGSGTHAVVQASSLDQGRELLGKAGPFAVVVCPEDGGGAPPTSLLEEVKRMAPDAIRVLATDFERLDEVVERTQSCGVFRFLDTPLAEPSLRSTILDALEEYSVHLGERRLTEELQFSKEALTHFTGTLEGRMNEQMRHLERLHQFVTDLNEAESLGQIVHLTARAARDVLGGRGTFVEFTDPTRKDQRYQSMAGPVLSDRRMAQEVATREGCLGTITLDCLDERGRELSSLDREILASIASSAAVASHTQVRRAERDEAQHHTILAMAKLAEQRDNETGQHIERVSRFCQLVAEGLREDGHERDLITDEWILDLYRSAPLHDIGKVGIPDKILLKPGKLDPEEWEIMKQHTNIGAETLRSVMNVSRSRGFLQLGLEIAWCHHERWDGSGYPRGLTAEEIPLSARILAVADVYDALTSKRPYKEPWSHEDSLAHILEGAGSHFDPKVVEAFASRSDEANSIRRELRDEPEEPGDEGKRAA